MAAAGCPDDEALTRVAAGSADDVEREHVMSHLDACSTCRRGLAALAALPPTPADSFIGGDHVSTFPDSPSAAITARVPPRPRPAGTAPPIPALGDRIGRYIALRIVGRGGMGIVIAAHDPELDRQVAIKLVHPRVWRAASAESRELLRLEARAMARLVHPNVVAVHDLGTVGDQLFVAMELVAGSSLDRWLAAAARPRPWRDVLAMCREAGKGIAAAHRAGLVHRDIKPHNVLVDEHGRPRIADFGLAMLGVDEGDASAPAGTPAYMSPEQHRGAATTAASDQFSFCVMTYEALYGERPFAGDTIAAIGTEIERGRVRPPPAGTNIPAWVRRVLLRGLAVDPAARFPTLDALLDALAPPARPRWQLGVAAIALAAAAAAAAMLLTREREDPIAAARRTAEARAAAVWSPAARRAVDAALAAGRAPHTIATRTRVADALDGYLARWIAARVAVIRGARAGEQAPAAAERRLACLDRRLGEVRALVAALSAGGPGVAAAAIDGVAELTPARICLDRDVMAVRPPPEEPSRRARHDELSRALDDVAALARVGREKDAAAAAAKALADVRALAHPPLLAEALLLHARQLAAVGDSDVALDAYRELMPVAAAAGDADLEARAWIELIILMINAGRGSPPPDILVAAGAAVARAGNPPALRRAHQRALAGVAISEGRHADAEAVLRAALAEAPADDPLRPKLVANLSTALAQQRKWDDVLALLDEAHAAFERQYGPDHPALARLWGDRHVALYNLARHDEAVAAARKMATLAEPGTITAGRAIMYEGGALLSSGRFEEALARYQAAADIFRDGGNRRQEYEVMMKLGATRFNLDQLAEAERALARAVELGKVIHADQPRQLAFAMTMRGMVAGDRGDAPAALAHCREAVALAELGGDDSPDLPFALPCLSRALRLSARAAEALPHAERGVRTADRLGHRNHRHQTRLELAHVLVALGRDRPRRAALVREALALEDDPERRAAIAKHFRADLR